SLAGGYTAWKNAGNRWVADRQFTPAQLTRYARHFTLPEVGETGQAKLLGGRVLCIGAGGLGSPVAFYLAAAGVGTLGIIDHDVVDLSNLQRQILHTTDRIGMSKVDSAQKTLHALNPEVTVIGLNEQGNCTSSAGKTEELGEVGQMPAGTFALDFERAFAGIPA